MLVIRDEQMSRFEQAARDRFVERMLEHLRGRLPRSFADGDETDQRRFIETACDAAGAYGFETEFDVARFLELVLAHGLAFGNTPETSWAKPILEDALSSPTRRMDELCERAGLGESPPTLTPAQKTE